MNNSANYQRKVNFLGVCPNDLSPSPYFFLMLLQLPPQCLNRYVRRFFKSLALLSGKKIIARNE